jgi:toxin ParE1/3/4
VIWTELAISDIRLIRSYIAQFNPKAAADMASRLLAAGDSLTDQPERGRHIGARRRQLAAVWPYLIRYRVTPDAVYVLRVRHGARRPE